MVDFLKNIGIKAYEEISAIATQPNLLFSNDSGQYYAEATYNLYIIRTLNKWIKKNRISISELEQVIGFIESSWFTYLSTHFKGKAFVFYFWGDCIIPALKVSVVSYYERLDLPFVCNLNKVHDMKEVLSQYKAEAKFDGIAIIESDQLEVDDVLDEAEENYTLTVYSKIFHC